MESKKSNIKRYGLIGKNIEYSFSRGYFKKKFETENLQDCIYTNFDLNQIKELKNVLSLKNIFGLNVTTPYKREVIHYLDRLSPAAEKVNAVNTIKFHKDGTTSGHNTDVYGFEKSLLEIINKLPKKALILGTGGASSAVAYVMKKLKIEFSYISRRGGENTTIYTDVDEITINEHELIINASPVGTFPNIDKTPDLPYQFLTKNHILYDLIYNPTETRFLREGKTRGSKILNGQKMLEYQAEKSWEIWNE
ncbi:MAG: shikimate dehydrogenase [Bacteroidota bacterium]|nr:shikimate dehydrogenase [Bacteroidota bacterium]